MPARPSHPLRRLTLGISALSVALGALVVASPAAAHDSLEAADPAPGSSVETMPGTITLTFSAALQTLTPEDTYVEVLSPSGEDLASGDEQVEGAVIRQGVGPATEAGEYTVEWRAVSSDGHPISDTFSFTVQSPSAGQTVAPVPPANDEQATTEPSRKPAATPTPSASETPGPAGAGGDEHRPFGEMLPWILLGVTGVAVVGALTALLVSRARGGASGDGPGPDRAEG
jgi:methionine-rich copper-binding protein CopC